MSFLNKRIRKLFLLLLVLCFTMLSGCGLTVTKVEGTAQSTTLAGKFEAETTEVATALATTQEERSALPTQNKTEKSVATSVEKTTAKKEKGTTTQKSTVATQAKTVTCTVEIECKKIFENIDSLRSEKETFLPSDGYILKSTNVTVKEESTAFDVLKKVCTENVCSDNCQYCRKSGIQLEYVYSPSYDSEYVRGIHQLYEKDCGTRSGWMYSVNGTFPNYGMNKYKIKNGDKIKFHYTCDLGEDF